MRGGAGPGSMHWALCIVWVSWAPTACQGQGRKGLQREEHISKCLLGLALSTVNHVSDMGRAPRGPMAPSGGVPPSPASPAPCSHGRRVCGLVAAVRPHLGGWSVPLPNAA